MNDHGHDHAHGDDHPHDHGHGHEGGHDHEPSRVPQPDLEDRPRSYHQRLAEALRELLIQKGVFTPAEFRHEIEQIDSPTPENGARLVARAWIDPSFRQRLLADPRAAAAEFGLDTGPRPIRVVENTPAVHNVIVCTLCSCYPRFLLGQPPDWYKSRSYRSRVVRDPRGVLAEFGTRLPEDTVVRVHDSTADLRYMVLPMRPEGMAADDEQALCRLVTRDCLIGVSVPRAAGV